MRPDLFKAVSRITDTMWPSVPAVPIMVMGATDGLYLRAAGIPTYGVQGFFMDRDDILNLCIVTNLPLPKSALPAALPPADDDVPF